jgi:hypothetical protein
MGGFTGHPLIGAEMAHAQVAGVRADGDGFAVARELEPYFNNLETVTKWRPVTPLLPFYD